VEEIIEIELDEAERQQLERSVEAVRELVASLQRV
jgi:malate/lactate dehydrogenase